jgi:hypothetical protein
MTRRRAKEAGAGASIQRTAGARGDWRITVAAGTVRSGVAMDKWPGDTACREAVRQ